MRTASPSARRGFTLIELLVAIVLLVVGLLSLARGAGEMIRHQTRAAALGEMSLLAQARFDAMRVAAARKTVDTLALVAGGSLTVSTVHRADTVLAGSGRLYTRYWVVTETPVGARTVILRVTPLQPGPQLPASADFSTIVAAP